MVRRPIYHLSDSSFSNQSSSSIKLDSLNHVGLWDALLELRRKLVIYSLLNCGQSQTATGRKEVSLFGMSFVLVTKVK